MIEAHDPGCVSRDSYSGAVNKADMQVEQEIGSYITEAGWKASTCYFPCFYVEQIRPDGVTLRRGENRFEIKPGEWVRIAEEGLSYAVAYMSVRLTEE